jgi:hypothetical protein
MKADAAPDQSKKSLLRFIVEQDLLRNKTLSTLMDARCSRYLPFLEIQPCMSAIKKMIKLMDYDMIVVDSNNVAGPMPIAFVFVAFKQKLITLLKDKKTTTYLKDLNAQLANYLHGNLENFNMWELTKKHYKDETTAAMVMAALFQDTSPIKLHLAFLDRASIQSTPVYSANMELLNDVIDSINIVINNSDSFHEIFYPKGVQKNLNRNIYHLYVPLYLAKSLVADGVNKSSAFAATLMLTITYEFISSAQDYRYVLQDPKTFTSLDDIKDIFGGYCGSMMGTYGTSYGMMFNKTFDTFRGNFERSTESAMATLLKR